MKTKLVQKHPFKGTQEFEIVDDAVNVRFKSLFKEEKLTVMLTILNPEPVVEKPYLHFHSRVKCGPLLSLYLNKPNKQEFDEFVDTLKQLATQEFNAFAGLSTSRPEGLASNVYEEPPEFDEPDPAQRISKVLPVEPARIEETIHMLDTYLDNDKLEPLIAALRALRDQPDSEQCLHKVIETFNGLGPDQGAVLTYAPYMNILLSDDPYESF